LPQGNINGRKFHYKISDGIAIVRPEQACDEKTTEALAVLVNSHLIESKSLIIDFSHTDYVESPGFRWIVRQFRQFEKTGKKLIVSGLSPVAQRAFKLLKLDELIESAATVSEAIDLVRPTKLAVA
jgi:anti-anti-sigma factor